MEQPPLPLDPERIIEGLESLLDKLAVMRAAELRMRSRMAEMTERTVEPEQIWRTLAQHRSCFKRAYRRYHDGIARSGEWRELLALDCRAARVLWSLARLHLVGVLHKCHVLGVLDVRADDAVIDAWCG